MPTRALRTPPVAATGPPTNGDTARLARSTAASIIQDVIDRGWPVGEVIGAEAEMLERYGVSRAIFREAVRLVEQQQVARMRRGPGGGLLVTEPTVEAIIDAAVVYLYRVGASLEEVFDARLALEEIVVDLAPERLDEADITALRAVVAEEAEGRVTDHRLMHATLAAATHNPALMLFVDIMNRLSVLWFHDRKALSRSTAEASRHAHQRIAEAVLAGDITAARRRMRSHLDAEVDFLKKRRSVRTPLPNGILTSVVTGREKRAELTARAIIEEVVAGDRQPGDVLGTEPDLMARHDVSRAVFREAARLLEHHGVAVMRRGPGGGLVVVPPQARAVTEVVTIYLSRHGMGDDDVADLRSRVELHLIDAVMQRLDEPTIEALDATVAAETDAFRAFDPSTDLHAVLARISGNRVLELVALVLIRLTRVRMETNRPKGEKAAMSRAVHESHVGIVDAMRASDAELARHRMRRHLTGMARELH